MGEKHYRRGTARKMQIGIVQERGGKQNQAEEKWHKPNKSNCAQLQIIIQTETLSFGGLSVRGPSDPISNTVAFTSSATSAS